METETSLHGNMELPVGMDWPKDRTDDGERRRDEGPGRERQTHRSGSDDKPDEDRIPVTLSGLKKKLQDEIGLDRSFEVKLREMPFGERRLAFLFLTVFMHERTMADVMTRLSYLEPDEFTHEAVESCLSRYVPATQVQKSDSFSQMVDQVMMGNTAFYIEGQPRVLLIDAKQYPARSPEQPVLEKVVRGSNDGFTETLIMNVGLVRRRLRDHKTVFEMMKVGMRSQTDVCIGYIRDIADPRLVESVRDKIKKIKIDGIPLADKQLEEMALDKGWSPFPMVRYTERPDVVAAQMLDGSVVIMTDTSPSAILLPTTLFDLVQHAEENRQNPFMGTYMRWVRFIGIFMSIFMLPIWYLYAANPYIRPDWLWFVGVSQAAELPLVLQFVIAELGIDLIRLAAIHTPAPLVTAMTLLSAIMIGDIAVKTGLFVNEVILYTAVSAIGMFVTPSYELGLANRVIRLALLLVVFLFKTPGFVIGTAATFIFLACARSFNRPYLWPLIPFNGTALMSILIRRPLWANKTRPSLNRPKKTRKQPA
ncbi:spore germination protein [Cohnella caldifontis]|uniref:spore germination protein n=1 Tax=Cohnella caldifontis TaxID=3027471 RepID=UPI0023EDE483|nr:spore germination protein [Cohnella sp. YIM B05605]